MNYGSLKVDAIVYTSGGADSTVYISGIAAGNFNNIAASGLILTSSGSQSQPSVSFVNDPDTGLYNSGANSLSFSTSGTARIAIDASGNVNIDSNTLYVDATNNQVGLGTSSPSGKLHIVGGPLIFDPIAAEGESNRELRFNVDGANYGYIRIPAGSGGALAIATGSINAAAERLRITNTGNVGINTTSPGTKLDVSETGSTSCIIRVKNDTTSVYLDANNGYAYLNCFSNHPLLFGTNNIERARIDSSGRLLVGTSTATQVGGATSALQVAAVAGFIDSQRFSADAFSPALKLVKSRSATIGTNTIVQANDGLGQVLFYGADGSTYLVGAGITAEVDGTPGTNDMPGRLVFSTTADGASSPTERMRISQAGNVGINKTTTKYKLDASEARIGDGCVFYSKSITKTSGTTHTATISFESQANAWEPKHVEVLFVGSLSSSSTTYATNARYMFSTINSIGPITELEDNGNGASISAAASGMNFVITVITTSIDFIGFTVRITCGGSGGGLPTGMTIA